MVTPDSMLIQIKDVNGNQLPCSLFGHMVTPVPLLIQTRDNNENKICIVVVICLASCLDLFGSIISE